MISPTPHYVLLANTSWPGQSGQWRFVLRPLDGSDPVEVSDVEPDIWGERLDLLTVVRGLESLDQPSRVTLVGCSRYVEQGILYGLSEWREHQWRWEYFGQMVPIRDADLWQRMDRAMQFHRVDCGQRRFDTAHDAVSGPHGGGVGAYARLLTQFVSPTWPTWIKYAAAVAGWCAVCLEAAVRSWQAGVRTTALLTSSLLLHRS